ncbi:MAG: glycine C-acetyltransferase, partial [Bacteroidetes bacterium SW_11_45_7]
INETTELRDKLWSNTRYFRQQLTEAGFEIQEGDHPIVPIMLYDAKIAKDFADELIEEGIYVIGFYYPVVPKGQARIRVQLSAAHDQEHLDRAIDAFKRIGEKHGALAKV